MKTLEEQIIELKAQIKTYEWLFEKACENRDWWIKKFDEIVDRLKADREEIENAKKEESKEIQSDRCNTTQCEGGEEEG